MSAWLHSVEFYVIMTVVAAAVLALCARPSRRGAVIEELLGGWLVEGDYEAEPRLCIECNEDGSVTIRRTGIRDLYMTGAMSLAISRNGFDLDIHERRTAGRGAVTEPATEAVFVLTTLSQEWYHIRYTCDPGNRFSAFSLHVRRGLKMTVDLRE